MKVKTVTEGLPLRLFRTFAAAFGAGRVTTPKTASLIGAAINGCHCLSRTRAFAPACSVKHLLSSDSGSEQLFGPYPP
ncbi:hypothetical protein BwDG23_69440 [Bradyrhizobium ottawaense]|nr:hypothetical protein BwSF12_04130 [Bradyrhizobium ottawaense]GMO37387.1 hypothetical protein BwSF21_45630 [Bradyrhizobium ottawaense]GMO45705.1 hypothetical protein BwSH14_61310 [Bradyrhizobium ottawaense]GMO72120.1 hypothetical protein BwSH17_31670 [Bradyrhizobium ottawaense]GMO79452.1 hypothetical protein BwSG20_56790 [Bradyrhizobium ottawaense]